MNSNPDWQSRERTFHLPKVEGSRVEGLGFRVWDLVVVFSFKLESHNMRGSLPSRGETRVLGFISFRVSELMWRDWA